MNSLEDIMTAKEATERWGSCAYYNPSGLFRL